MIFWLVNRMGGSTLARDALTYLEGMRVDCRKQSLGQEKIVYDHPKAKNVCGCGISFNLDQDED